MMQPLAIQQWCSPSPEATHTLGMRLGRCAVRGDVIACNGPLGAGKTALVQGFAIGAGVDVAAYVRSPTFALVHVYRADVPLYHFDFYRLSHYTEVQDIGFEDYLAAEGVIIVEWADKFPEVLPPHRLDVQIRLLTSEERAIEGRVYSPAYMRYLQLTP